MVTVTSPIIVYAQTVTQELKDHVVSLRKELSKTRLRSYDTLRFWRTPNEAGDWNHKNTGNILHRATKHTNAYFTCPVLVNHDDALTMKGLMEAVELIRYTDMGRFYLVNLKEDGTYTVDLYQNTNTSYNRFSDVELTDPKEIKHEYA